MKFNLFLVLTLAGLLVCGHFEKYSIEEFIEYLQFTGCYYLIQKIKCFYSIDIAITFCKILFGSNHCERVVRSYMSCQGEGNNHHGESLNDLVLQAIEEIGINFEDFDFEEIMNVVSKINKQYELENNFNSFTS